MIYHCQKHYNSSNILLDRQRIHDCPPVHKSCFYHSTYAFFDNHSTYQRSHANNEILYPSALIKCPDQTISNAKQLPSLKDPKTTKALSTLQISTRKFTSPSSIMHSVSLDVKRTQHVVLRNHTVPNPPPISTIAATPANSSYDHCMTLLSKLKSFSKLENSKVSMWYRSLTSPTSNWYPWSKLDALLTLEYNKGELCENGSFTFDGNQQQYTIETASSMEGDERDEKRA